jgi:diguanylate cyclase (GGDEF)-like protein
LTREWNAVHGGVYVPVTKETPPNPHLQVPLKNIRVNSELMLTKINPAYMTRQLSRLAESHDGVQFNITSLKPLNPDNRPSVMEKRALESFEQSQPEFFYRQGSEFFYMGPLVTKKVCLQCHAVQGYKAGDIRGGISIRLPLISSVSKGILLANHLMICLFGITVILFFSSRLNRAYEEIKRQAIYDALTNIPNRREFTRRILSEFQRARRNHFPLSLIMCDIDWFKEFNDTYGHSAGDECLRQVAQALAGSLSRPGDFCARYGGEEFIVILPSTDENGAQVLADRIIGRVRSLAIRHSGSSYGIVTISLGVATEREFRSSSSDSLIKRADQALYLAKDKGRNRIEMEKRIS